jgi:hypothetical protein
MTSPTSADFVTRHEFELAMARIDARFDQFEARMDARFAQVDVRFAQMEALIERGLAANIRWTVGISFGLYALMFGLILFVVSRELPHT